MKKQIRRGVFETNSSSVHAICISKSNEYKTQDNVDFIYGRFGWSPETLYTPEEKASYL